MIELKKIYDLDPAAEAQDVYDLPVSTGTGTNDVKKISFAVIKVWITAFVTTLINGMTQGPQGPAGAAGAQGIQGPQGIPGVKGDQGGAGVAGAQGPAGPIGIQGPKGDKGDQGYTGAQGTQGVQGLKGDKGDQGDTGPAGADGAGNFADIGGDPHDNAALDAVLTGIGTDVTGKEDLTNKATDLTSNDDTHYPTVKAVKTVTDANATAIVLKENVSNKATDLTSNDDMHYPTVKAVKTVTDANATAIAGKAAITYVDSQDVAMLVAANGYTDRIKADRLIAFNPQTGTAYTLVLADADMEVTMNNVANNTLTIPTNASVAYPIGTRIFIRNIGIGITTVVGASGVTVNGIKKYLEQYNEAFLVKQGTNTWACKYVAPDMSAIDSDMASIKRSPSLNTVLHSNTVNSVGGFGNSLLQTANTQGITRIDAGMPTGTNIAVTAMQWVKFTTSVAVSGCIMGYGSGSSGLEISVWNDGGVVILNGSTVIFQLSTGVNMRDGNWHHVAVRINGAVCHAIIDGVSYTIPSVTTYNIALNGTLKTNGVAGNKAVIGYVDQLLIYNASVSTTDIQSNYNSGVGTLSVYQTNLIARYEFEGNLSDTNPTGTPVTATFIGSTNYAGNGNGLVPEPGSTNEVPYIRQKDGLHAGESSTVEVGDHLSGTGIFGKTIRNIINSIVTYVNTSTGHFFSLTNTSEVKAAKNVVDIDGGFAVGAANAGTNTAPANGGIIQGRTLIGTIIDDLSSILQLGGNLYLALGFKIKIATGTNASVGKATLVGGTVTVPTTAVTAASLIDLTYDTPSGTVGVLAKGTVTAGTSFVINSLVAGTAGTLNAADASVVYWKIIN